MAIPHAKAVEQVRQRQSLATLAKAYDGGDKAPLEAVWRAWKGIKALPADDPRSFFNLGGLHGEPFRGKGKTDPNFWGGWCAHGNIQFPTWHRAYLLKLEEALRSFEPSVSLPFWDETDQSALDAGEPIPWPLTRAQIHLDGEWIENPLRSFKLPKEIIDEADKQYNKPAGYNTVRYPYSGLTDQPNQAEIEAYNKKWHYDDATKALNKNITEWFTTKTLVNTGGQEFPTDVYSRWIKCLDAPNYGAFSNTSSASVWNKLTKPAAGAASAFTDIVPLESPHNSVHLATGGFNYPGQDYNRNPEGPGYLANGDMGENDTAGLDPIFYFHHCFVDYTFWVWQQRHNEVKALTIPPALAYPALGAHSSDINQGQGATPIWDQKPDQALTVDSPLYPFLKHSIHDKPTPVETDYYTSNDVADAAALGYAYGPGSLHQYIPHVVPHHGLPTSIAPLKGAPAHSVLVTVDRVDRAAHQGSFIIAAYADVDNSGTKKLVAFEPVLSRWNVKGCLNCQTHLEAKAYFQLPTNSIVDVNQWKNDTGFEVQIITNDNKGAPAVARSAAIHSRATAGHEPHFNVSFSAHTNPPHH